MENELSDPLHRPLCVDMDGTLLRTDALHEAVWTYLRSNPLRICNVFFWILLGRSVFKDEIFSRVTLSIDTLPVNDMVLEFITREKERGRMLILATASPAVIAQQVAKRFLIFDEVLATDRNKNLKGVNKATALVDRFGLRSFDYIGDSAADLHVWEKAHTAHCVGTLPKHKLSDSVYRGEDFPVITKSRIAELLRAIRVHQWVKNFLVFIPAMMAHSIIEPTVLSNATRAFFAFSFTASAVYVLNDLIDIDSDRIHKSKRRRPFASGSLPLWLGFLLIPFLISIAVLFSPLQPDFLVVLLGYFLLTTCYSFFLKRIVLLDIFTLASLYTVRIFAGSVATDTLISPWLLAFSVFIFLSLACVKRASEIYNLQKTSGNDATLTGRGYRVTDFDQISRFGSSSGYLAVLILALYISSTDVKQYYSSEQVLWFVCPVFLYWISRVWLLTARGELHEDPIVFALKDPVSYVVGVLCLAILFIAL